MRKIHDILRLNWACGLSNRQVAASCGVADERQLELRGSAPLYRLV